MSFDEFKEIILLLYETSNKTDKATKFVRTDLFDSHNKLISTLLEKIYEPEAVSFILYEWLIGNKSELKVTTEENTIVYPLDTIEDLYQVMQMYIKSKE